MSTPKYQSIRLFKSDFLEQFTHVHPALPALLWGPVMVWLFYTSYVNTTLGLVSLFALFGFGILVWTFTEYTLHRFVFHYEARSQVGKRIVYLMHGLHHDDPKDPTRLVMPPLPALIYAFLLFSVFKATLGPIYVMPFFSGFLLGYLAYDYIHYYVHHFNPKTRLGKYLKRYHLVHHFKDHGAKWGVSSPLWDYVLGTAEERSVNADERSTQS